MRKIRIRGTLALILAMIVAWVVANIPQNYGMGLGIVVSWYGPLIIGGLEISIFLLLSLFIKKVRILKVILLIMILYALYMGLDLNSTYSI
ncbi:MAG: hypothetical protein RJQ09_20700 [Cyclobacteriaceae bacterium]